LQFLVGYAVDKGSLKKTGPERFWVAPAAHFNGGAESRNAMK
jgi:hypothetical protein